MASFGKKIRNPGWESGNHWVECDMCGFIIRAEDAKVTWDNLVVCPEDYEPRHPQDFVRAQEEDQAADEPVRPESEDTFVTVSNVTQSDRDAL